jgi:hypothetical protein
MKEAFKRSMVFLYPQGADNIHQWRDLVRTFVMGWNEALMKREDREGLLIAMDVTKSITDKFWFPDKTWKWW